MSDALREERMTIGPPQPWGSEPTTEGGRVWMPVEEHEEITDSLQAESDENFAELEKAEAALSQARERALDEVREALTRLIERQQMSTREAGLVVAVPSIEAFSDQLDAALSENKPQDRDRGGL